jgi:putative aldouronate transport system permease protein
MWDFLPHRWRASIFLLKIIGSSQAFYPLVIGSGIWKEIGWGAIIYLAAIAGISPELYEAATVDGASRLQRALHITLPGLIPVIVIMLILRIGSILSVNYLQIMILIGGDSSLLEVGDVIQYWVYRVGFFQMNFSVATAVGLFNGVIGLILVWGANKVANKLTDSGLW